MATSTSKNLVHRRIAVLSAGALIGFGLSVNPVAAGASSYAAPSTSVKISTPSVSLIKGQTFTVSGSIPTGATSVALQRKESGVWKPVVASIAITGSRWDAKLAVPTTGANFTIRASTETQSGNSVQFKLFSAPTVTMAGPGKRILGADISRWQHSSKAINFAVMKKAGVGFVIIKASDGMASEDKLAKAYAVSDSQAALKAGIYVGYYHRARVPVTNVPSAIRTNAIKQATVAANRLALLGGYSSKTLPYVIDIEGVDDRVKPAAVTLWLTTWVTEMTRLTKRSPIVYSYRSLLANRVTKDATTVTLLRQSHLWLAQPGDPANSKVLVGKKVSGKGCFQLAWTFGACRLPWTVWQYTNSGDREKFGIPWSPRKGKCLKSAKFCTAKTALGRYHLDLNVFNGSPADLAAFARGTLNRSVLDYR